MSDQLVKCKLSNGNVIHYRIINGTAYHEETNKPITDYLEKARLEGGRVRFNLGDTRTGIDWGDTLDCCGYIGRSTGEIKIPILLKNNRSIGGPGLLDHCIIKIEYKGPNDKRYREVYRHKTYQRS